MDNLPSHVHRHIGQESAYRLSTAAVVEEISGVIRADAVVTDSTNDYTDDYANIPAQILPETTDEGNQDNLVNVEDDDEDADEEYEYEYEDDDDAAYAGFLDNPIIPQGNSIHHTHHDPEEPATIRDEEEPKPSSSKWRQPSHEAVSMSLRAEQETTGGKRRLAQDLYRIMNQDTQEAGFSLKPQSEDSMKKWTIMLFQFDPDSNLAKDMKVLGVSHVELEMTFPDQYPFEPPFVRVVRPRFKRQTGFVMNGALCMELLTNDGWNPVNDIESVIVSIRSLLVVGDGRLEAAYNLTEKKYNELLAAGADAKSDAASDTSSTASSNQKPDAKRQRRDASPKADIPRLQGGTYSVTEAEAAYNHLSDYHKKKGWDTSGWWAKKG